MTEITQAKANRFKEMETKRHSLEMRKVRGESEKNYKDEVKANEKHLKRMRDEFAVTKLNLENELERKLKDVQMAHKVKIRDENRRLGQELTELKKSHDSRVIETKETNMSQLDKMMEEHKESIDTARTQYKKSINKYQFDA